MIKLPSLIRYKVQKNDTLYGIAKKYNVDWDKLIYRTPINEEFRKQFPDPHQIDFVTPDGKPVFVYVPIIVQWDEREILSKVKKFLPPFPTSSSDGKNPSTVAGKEREVTISRIQPIFLCAAYDIPTDYVKSFVVGYGRFHQRWTYSLTLKGRAMLDSDGRIDFGQNSTSHNTLTISGQGNKIAIDMFSRISVSYELDKALQLGITLFELDSIKVGVSTDWPSLGATVTKTQSIKLGGIDCKVSFTLTISPMISSYKMTITEIPKGEKCGLQVGSFIKVEWWEETFIDKPARQLVPIYIPTMIILNNQLPELRFRYIPSPREVENSYEKGHHEHGSRIKIPMNDMAWYQIIGIMAAAFIYVWMSRLAPVTNSIMPLAPNLEDESYY